MDNNTFLAGFQNYKTTICGVLTAVITAIANYQGNGGWKGYAVAAGIAAFGFLAHDGQTK